MRIRAMLLKLTFIFSSLSIVIFGFVLKQGLTAFALAGLFIILAGFIMNDKKNISQH